MILSISSHIYVPGPFTVRTDAEHLQLYVPQTGSDYPMALLNLPATKIHKNTSIGENGQYTVFENYTSWQSFVHNTIFLSAGSLGLKGKVGTQLGKIKKFTLDLDKQVPSNGEFSCFRRPVFLLKLLTWHLMSFRTGKFYRFQHRLCQLDFTSRK